MAAAGMSICSLPVEMVYSIVSVILAEHFDSLLLGSESQARLPFCHERVDDSVPPQRPDVAEALLLVSRQVYQITLHVLSASLDIPFRECASDTHLRLQDNPWVELARLRTLRNLLSPRPRITSVKQLEAEIENPRRGVGVAYRAILLLQLDTRLSRDRLQRYPSLSIPELRELQTLHQSSVPAVGTPNDIVNLPDAFRSVIAKHFDLALADKGIFLGYDIYAIEVEYQWNMLAIVLAIGEDNSSSTIMKEYANRICELIQRVHDTDTGLRNTWKRAIPLDHALGEDKLVYWCALLHRMLEVDSPSEHVVEVKKVALALVQALEPRLERIRRDFCTTAD